MPARRSELSRSHSRRGLARDIRGTGYSRGYDSDGGNKLAFWSSARISRYISTASAAAIGRLWPCARACWATPEARIAAIMRVSSISGLLGLLACPEYPNRKRSSHRMLTPDPHLAGIRAQNVNGSSRWPSAENAVDDL